MCICDYCTVQASRKKVLFSSSIFVNFSFLVLYMYNEKKRKIFCDLFHSDYSNGVVEKEDVTFHFVSKRRKHIKIKQKLIKKKDSVRDKQLKLFAYGVHIHCQFHIANDPQGDIVRHDEREPPDEAARSGVLCSFVATVQKASDEGADDVGGPGHFECS